MTLRLKLAAFASIVCLGLTVGIVAQSPTNVLNPASDLAGKTLVTAEGNRTITGTWSFSVPARLNPGTTGAPGIVSTSDQTTGWQLGVATIGGSIAGTQRLLLNTSGLTLFGVQTVNSSGVAQVVGGGTGLSSGTAGNILAFTAGTTIGPLAGTSGGIVYFNAANTAASSGALGANALVLGGGAGAAPTTDTNWVINSSHVLNSSTQYRAVAYNNNVQSINSATVTTLTLNSEDLDVGNMHDTVTNNSRVTIPAGGDGYYMVRGSTNFATNATGARLLFITKNGVTTLRQNGFGGSLSAGTQTDGIEATWFGNLVATDYVEIQGYQESGGALNVGSATRALGSDIAVTKLW